METLIEKRKPGRPATGKRKHNTVISLFDSEKAQLVSLAKELSTPLATLMRNLIFQYPLTKRKMETKTEKKKMGRPRIAPEKRRTKYVAIPLTIDEWTSLKSNSSKSEMNLTNYMRTKIFHAGH